mmetsp:Transcript_122265/g.280070  ORF Transcript_122265/g.280070 Transcript_122265/m.280070 type:complete len:200 (-) Transcript_122265:1387-1986(-)
MGRRVHVGVASTWRANVHVGQGDLVLGLQPMTHTHDRSDPSSSQHVCRCQRQLHRLAVDRQGHNLPICVVLPRRLRDHGDLRGRRRVHRYSELSPGAGQGGAGDHHAVVAAVGGHSCRVRRVADQHHGLEVPGGRPQHTRDGNLGTDPGDLLHSARELCSHTSIPNVSGNHVTERDIIVHHVRDGVLGLDDCIHACPSN